MDNVYIICRKENKKGSIRSIREAWMETMHASYKKGLNYFASSVSWSFLVSVVDTYIKVYSIVEKYKSSVKIQNIHSKWLL